MSGIVWKDWDPGRVKAAIAENTARNLEIACKFVETQARANLIGITVPRWGRSYREKVLAPRVAFEIVVEKDFVEGRVGIRRGAREEYHGAYYIEIGTRKFPAHPWLRPAVFNNAHEILQLLEGK